MDIKVSKEQFCDMMRSIIDYKCALSDFACDLEDGGFLRLSDDNAFDHFLCNIIDNFAKLLGLPEDEYIGNDLSWYIFETECGVNNTEVEIDGVEFSIESLEDLYDLVSGEFLRQAAENKNFKEE